MLLKSKVSIVVLLLLTAGASGRVRGAAAAWVRKRGAALRHRVHRRCCAAPHHAAGPRLSAPPQTGPRTQSHGFCQQRQEEHETDHRLATSIL